MKDEKDALMAMGELKALNKVIDALDSVISSIRSGPSRDFSVMYQVSTPLYEVLHKEKLKAFERI